MSLRKKLVWAFFIGLLLFLLCMILTGGGHGWMWPLISMFPWFTLAFMGVGESSVIPQFLLFLPAILQFPAYVSLANKNWLKSRNMRWVVILIIHALVAVSIYVMGSIMKSNASS